MKGPMYDMFVIYLSCIIFLICVSVKEIRNEIKHICYVIMLFIRNICYSIYTFIKDCIIKPNNNVIDNPIDNPIDNGMTDNSIELISNLDSNFYIKL